METLIDIGMALGPVTGYILQYRLILKNQSVGAFSTDICLVLLIANILRLNFYIFQAYQLALVFQSIFMITAQLILLHICCQYREQHKQSCSTEGEKGDSFWRWRHFTLYWQHTLIFTIASFIISTFFWFLEFQTYGQLVGLIALMTESLLIVPQILSIYKVRRVEGISYWLIFLNLLGDTFKTFYFFYKDQPFQFKLCGIIQLILDIVVISQIAYYTFSNSNPYQEETPQIQQDKKPTEQEIQQYKSDEIDENNEDLEGSLSKTVVIQQNLDGFQSKRSQTQVNLG